MILRLFLVFLLFLSTARTVRAEDDCAYAGTDTPVELQRGVNLSEWWEKSTAKTPDADDVESIHIQGFDFVRIPLDPVWLEGDPDDRTEKLAQLHCDIAMVLNHDLAVVLDLHASRTFKGELAAEDPRKAANELSVLWQRLLPALKGFPSQRLLLEFFNEPGIEADTWWRMQGQLVRALRPVFPHNTFIASGGEDDGPWNLEPFKPYADRNVIYDFHYYQPLLFTHNGAEWLPAEDRHNYEHISYPADAGIQTSDDDVEMREYIAKDWNRETLANAIDEIATWRDRHHVKVICLEFGVYRPYVDTDSRLNWLRDMRNVLESYQIPWALWEYRGNFGLVDARGEADKPMATALGLGDSSP